MPEESLKDWATRVVTVTRPPVPHFTDVPEFLREHFASTGKRISWQADSATQLSMSSVQYVYPIQVDSLPKDIASEIAKTNLEIRSDGRIHRGDCVLCVQSNDIYEQYQAYYHDLHRQQSDSEAFVERFENELQRLSARTGRRTGRRLVPETETVPPVEAQIAVAKKPLRAQDKE